MDHDVGLPEQSLALVALAQGHLSLRMLTAIVTSFPQRERERVRAWLTSYEGELTTFEGRAAEIYLEELPASIDASSVVEIRKLEVAAIQLVRKSIPF